MLILIRANYEPDKGNCPLKNHSMPWTLVITQNCRTCSKNVPSANVVDPCNTSQHRVSLKRSFMVNKALQAFLAPHIYISCCFILKPRVSST